MHFALPPRKSSFPPPYARSSARTAANQKRKLLQRVSYFVLGVLSIYLVVRLIRREVTKTEDGAIPADSSVLIVTVMDESTMSEDYMHMIKTNREDYAVRHGYKTFFTNITTYSKLTDPSPSSWSLVPAIRHALTLYPETSYIWSLSPDALITNVTLDLYHHILEPLPSLMLKDIPVVPPDSVIHTFSHLRPAQAYLILSQDMDNIAHTSFLLRNTKTIPVSSNHQKDTWTNYLLDAWFDPLYRTYAFQKAENHALEHIVQWHPTILAKIVMINQRSFNSYNFQPSSVKDPETETERTHDSMWQQGDLLINFKGCTDIKNDRDCEGEMRTYFAKWMDEVEKVDGKRPDVKLKVNNAEYKPGKAVKRKIKKDAKLDYEQVRRHI